MGADLFSMGGLDHLLAPGNPYGAQAGQSQRYGRRAAGFHGAGSGHAARAGFQQMTMLDREAARRQQLQALAQLVGDQLNTASGIAGHYGMGMPAQAQPTPNPVLQPTSIYSRGQLVPIQPGKPTQGPTAPGADYEDDPYSNWG